MTARDDFLDSVDRMWEMRESEKTQVGQYFDFAVDKLLLAERHENKELKRINKSLRERIRQLEEGK